MQKIIEVRRRKQQEMVFRAWCYGERLRARIGPLSGFVIGSVARGDFNLGSDIDVLVVSDRLPTHPLARSQLLYELTEGELEPKGYTVAEFQQMLVQNHPLAWEVLEQGIVLRDDLKIAQRNAEFYERM